MKQFTILFENYNIQCYEIDIGKIRNYKSISHLLKPFKIVRYTYEFICNGKTLKYGLSNDERSRMPVERLYRLAGNLPGWMRALKGPSGAEMIEYCENFLHTYNEPVHKNNVILRVHDFSSIPSPNVSDPDHVTKKHERELIRLHEQSHGFIPPGNIKDEKHMDNKYFVSTDNWFRFIEEEK